MKKILGIELGSTRIKSVLIDENACVLAQGSFGWENKLSDGIWTYSLGEVESGLQASFSSLASDYKAKFCSYHSKELYRVLKYEFNSFMLDIIFQIGYIPDQFELVFNGNKTIEKPYDYKEQWTNNKNLF